MFKKSYLLAAIIPLMLSCTAPGTNSSDPATALATKADAVKYFECALNNPGLTDAQKTTIRNTVIAQINLIPDIAWAQAKAGFEAYLKTYGCGTTTTPTSSPSVPSGTATAQPGNSGSTLTINSKEEYSKMLQCEVDGLKAKSAADPKNTAIVLDGIQLGAEFNAARFLDDATFVQQKARLVAVAEKYKAYCNANAPVSTPATGTTKVAGITENSCDLEKTLKSASGPSINITFTNNSSGKVKIYWLDQSGTRRSYNAGLAVGAKHPQQTFVTHPWVITDANDKCLKIFVPSDASADGANINI
jgi:hypothetical protein